MQLPIAWTTLTSPSASRVSFLQLCLHNVGSVGSGYFSDCRCDQNHSLTPGLFVALVVTRLCSQVLAMLFFIAMRVVFCHKFSFHCGRFVTFMTGCARLHFMSTMCSAFFVFVSSDGFCLLSLHWVLDCRWMMYVCDAARSLCTLDCTRLPISHGGFGVTVVLCLAHGCTCVLRSGAPSVSGYLGYSYTSCGLILSFHNP